MARMHHVPDNIINHRRLAAETPPDPMRLDYRSQPTTPDQDHRFAVAFLTASALVVGLAVMAIHIVGDRLLNPAVIASFASLGFTIAIVVAIRGARLWVPLSVIAAGPLLPLALALLHYATRLPSLIVIVAVTGVALATWLLYLLGVQQARWLATGPRVRYDRVIAWRAVWSEPWHWALKAPSRLYLLYPLVIGFAGFALIRFLGLGGNALQGPILIGLVIASIALGYGGLFPSEALRRFGQHIACWLAYGRGHVGAPGVFASPAGRLRKRQTLTVATLFLLSSASLVTSGFWGVFVQADPAAWQALFVKTLDQQASATAAFAAARHFELEKLSRSDARPGPQESAEQFKLRREADEKKIRATWEAKQFERFLTAEPMAWIWLALDGVATGEARYLWALLTAALLTILYPVAALGLTAALVLGFVEFVVGRDVRKHIPPETGPTGETEWNIHRNRLRVTENPLEKDHLWMGAHAYDDYPVLLHRPILSEHAYIVGDSGSGKSALGLTGILLQLIDRQDAPVVILDLKGDPDMFQAIRAHAGERFRFFTVERGRSTHTFNPFEQGTSEFLTLNQVVETVLESLQLNHGAGYGRSFFSRMARWFVRKIFGRKPDIATFTELYEEIQKENAETRSKGKGEAEELVAVIESLTSFEQLNITAKSRRYDPAVLDQAIHMPRVLEENQVVYFWLPSVLESASAAEIAKLAIYAMLQAGFMHQQTHGVAKQAYLAIDEFQRIASSNFKVVLEQARSLGIGAILANQTIADLNTPDIDLRPTVQTNTRLKMCFSASDLEQQDALIQGSGEAIDFRYSVSFGKDVTESFSEYTRPRLQRNDIIRASDDPNQCILQVHRGSGYTQLSGLSIPIRMSFTMTAAQRAELRQLGWPDDAPGTIKVTRGGLPVERDPEARIELGKKLIQKAQQEQPTKPVDFNVEIEGLAAIATELGAASELSRYGGPFE